MRISLMYHDVFLDHPEESGMNVIGANQYKLSAAEFENQVSAIADYIAEKGIPKSDIEFTFDDGGSSFGAVIPDILERYGFKGVFFISSDFVDVEGYITSNQVTSLVERGHIVGSHTKSHPEHLEKMSDAEIEVEWKESLSKLSALTGVGINYASLPNGNGSARILRIAAEQGVKNMYSSEPTMDVRMKYGMTVRGRYVVHEDMGKDAVLRLITSYWYRSKKQFRYKAIECLKFVLGDGYVWLKAKIVGE